MSYTITVVKDQRGVWVVDIPEVMLRHIPDGTWTITGHVPMPGASRVAGLSVTQTANGRGLEVDLVARASCEYMVPAVEAQSEDEVV